MMRGLAFPTNAIIDREASYEYGTPISNVDEIPIDPALSGALIDPSLMMDDSSTTAVQTQPEAHNSQQEAPQEDYQIRQYSQGPQGDPFAPQLPPPFFPIEQQQPLPPPKPKRKRRIRREEECSFCQGNDTRNTKGDPELMLTCHLCGRSGHPSCMELEKQAEVMRSYEWKCIECKNCELCKEKGDDERILFCDWCDRGWHLDCMVPPLETPPEGAWHCPACPDLLPEGQESLNYIHRQPEETPPQSPFFTAERETSVASTSRSVIEVRAPRRGRGGGKKRGVGRGRGVPKVAVTSENSDGDGRREMETPALSRGRGRLKPSGKGKARVATPSSDEELTVSPIRSLKRKRTRQLSPVVPLPRVRLRLPPRGKGKGREEEEAPHGLFDDVLGAAERDTSKTCITNLDKAYFERSRLSAEDKLAPPPPTASSSRTINSAEFSTPMHRPLRSATLQHIPSRIDLSHSPAPSTPGGPLPKFEPGVLRIQSIRFGQYDIKTWYDAPFPEEYASIPDGRLWICEFCLKYMKSRFGAFRHRLKCHARNPPGDEIYRDGVISIFEVDGRRNKIYCQNLCLLSKMFLDHKSLFYDVEPFLFYVITETDEFGARFVGYFSKEKRCPKEYNLSCIMTLPVRQRQGWGNLLIDFSYLLSKIEQRLGSPEKPLSSLGALGYKSYWTLAIMRFLRSTPENTPVRLQDISTGTSMTMEDVCSTLIQLNMIFIREASPPPIRPSPGQTIKFPKGRKNGIARKHLQRLQAQDKELDGVKAPFVVPKNYEIHFDRTMVEAYLSNWESKGYLKLKPEKLQWTPYIVTRNPKEAGLNVDLPAMDTVVHDNSRMSLNGQSAEPMSESVPESISPLPGFTSDIGLESIADPVAELITDLVIESTNAPVTESIAEGVTKSMAVPSTNIVRPSPDAMIIDYPTPKHVIEEDELRVIVPSTPSRSRSRAQSSTRSSVKPSLSTQSPSPSSPPSPVFASPPPPRTLRRNRSQAKYASPVMQTDPEPTPVRPKRGRPPKPISSRKMDEDDEDEALAAKLANEERVQGRQLRSRPSVSQLERKRVTTPVSIPKAPGRKRRRIDSSPETGESPSTEPEEISQYLNGKDLSPAPMIVEPDAPKVNGKHRDHSGEDDSQFETQTPEDGLNAERNVDMVVKAEDGGTPLTNFTSRQSVPSDDTIFMAEVHVHMGKSSNSFADFRGAVHAESDIRSTLAPEEWHDEDADGEYDEDIEGEAEIMEGYYCT